MIEPPFKPPKPMVSGHRHLAGTGRAALVNELRRLQMRQTAPQGAVRERCDICGQDVPSDHRHVLDLTDRRIMCTCETCLVRMADNARYRPVGQRVVSLDDFELSDELWARFAIPVGLAFFFRSSIADQIVALYPSPLGATESELDMSAWNDLVAANPPLSDLEPDAEALLVQRTKSPHSHFIVPIDQCYELVGIVKSSWHGISGGPEADRAIAGFFERLGQRVAAP